MLRVMWLRGGVISAKDHDPKPPFECKRKNMKLGDDTIKGVKGKGHSTTKKKLKTNIVMKTSEDNVSGRNSDNMVETVEDNVVGRIMDEVVVLIKPSLMIVKETPKPKIKIHRDDYDKDKGKVVM